MAAEAEAAREARAKVIAAEGEKKASRALREASEVISESPSALQVRLLFYLFGWISLITSASPSSCVISRRWTPSLPRRTPPSYFRFRWTSSLTFWTRKSTEPCQPPFHENSFNRRTNFSEIDIESKLYIQSIFKKGLLGSFAPPSSPPPNQQHVHW